MKIDIIKPLFILITIFEIAGCLRTPMPVVAPISVPSTVSQNSQFDLLIGRLSSEIDEEGIPWYYFKLDRGMANGRIGMRVSFPSESLSFVPPPWQSSAPLKFVIGHKYSLVVRRKNVSDWLEDYDIVSISDLDEDDWQHWLRDAYLRSNPPDYRRPTIATLSRVVPPRCLRDEQMVKDCINDASKAIAGRDLSLREILYQFGRPDRSSCDMDLKSGWGKLEYFVTTPELMEVTGSGGNAMRKCPRITIYIEGGYVVRVSRDQYTETSSTLPLHSRESTSHPTTTPE